MDPYQHYPTTSGLYSGQRPATASGVSRQHFASSTGNVNSKNNGMYREGPTPQKPTKVSAQQGTVAPPPPLIHPRKDSAKRAGPRSPSTHSQDATKNHSYSNPNSARGVTGQQQRMAQMGAYSQQKAAQYSAQQRAAYQGVHSPHHGSSSARNTHSNRFSTGGFSQSTTSLTSKAAESQPRAQEAARAAPAPQRPRPQTQATTQGSTQTRRPAKQDPAEDETGHYQVVKGQTIDHGAPFASGRYSIVKLLGTGTYGKVVQCEDHKYNRAGVAIKLVRREPPLYRVSAKNEIAILRDLGGKHGTLKLLRDFEHMGHVCMTFELLGDHLSDVLQKMGRPFKPEHVRDITLQMLHAVAYVHSKGIIHTDIKAENILLVGGGASGIMIKVVDFGSALYSSAWRPPLVGTMHYRGPEAVLQAGWSFPLDVWAVGCLACELSTGQHLFELAHDDVHLYMMERALGPIPADLLRKGYANLNQYNRSLLQSDARGGVRIAPCRMEGFQMVAKMRRLRDVVGNAELLSLVRHMLEYEPSKRISAAAAIEHPFFEVVDDGTDSIEAAPDPHAALLKEQAKAAAIAHAQAMAYAQAQAKAQAELDRQAEEQRLDEQRKVTEAQAQAAAKARASASASKSTAALKTPPPRNQDHRPAPAPVRAPVHTPVPDPVPAVIPGLAAADESEDAPKIKVVEPLHSPAPPIPLRTPQAPLPSAVREAEKARSSGVRRVQAAPLIQFDDVVDSAEKSEHATMPRPHHRARSMGGAELAALRTERAEEEQAGAVEGGLSDYVDGGMSDYPLVSAPSRAAQAEAAQQDLDAFDMIARPTDRGMPALKPRPLVDSDKPPPVPSRDGGAGTGAGAYTESEQSQSSTAPWSGRVSNDSDYADGSSEPKDGSMTPQEYQQWGQAQPPAGLGWGAAQASTGNPPPSLMQGGGAGWPAERTHTAPASTAQLLGEVTGGARAE